MKNAGGKAPPPLPAGTPRTEAVPQMRLIQVLPGPIFSTYALVHIIITLSLTQRFRLFPQPPDRSFEVLRLWIQPRLLTIATP